MKCAAPARATRPDPDARHELRSIMAATSLMQRRDNDYKLVPAPLLEHQRMIARVASERAANGRYKYPIVVVTLPRRSGKTVLLEGIQVQRSLTIPGHRSFYTAQTITAAWNAWGDLRQVISDSPALAPYVASRRLSMASAELRWVNGSIISPFTPSPSGLDGKNADLVIIDEAFAFKEGDGNLLMASVSPTLLNRPNGQMWIVSTAGHAESTWFRSWIDQAASQLDTPNPRIALFDWSMRDGGDPDDPEEWAKFHPGYSTGLTTLDGMRDAQARCKTREEWLRGYCNRWSETAVASFLDLEHWDALASPGIPLPDDPDDIYYAIDVANDASAATIAAAWQHDGTPHTVIVRRDQGTEWLADAIAALDAWRIDAYPNGPTQVIVDQLPDDQRATIHLIKHGEFLDACQTVTTRTRQGSLTHDGSPSLRNALANAAPRVVRETTTIDAAKSRGPVDAARAAIIALHHAAQPSTMPTVI